jgi:hypothetical protein
MQHERADELVDIDIACSKDLTDFGANSSRSFIADEQEAGIGSEGSQKDYVGPSQIEADVEPPTVECLTRFQWNALNRFN